MNCCFIIIILFIFMFSIFLVFLSLNNRFECWSDFRNKKYYKRKSYDEIIPNLYIGNIDSANNLSFIKDKKIKVIINCSKQIPNFFESQKEQLNLEYYRLPVADSLLDEDIKDMEILLPQFVNIINNALLENKPVLVHCYAGRQRSACLIAAYLIYKYKYSLDEVYKFILLKRKEAFHYGKSFNFNRSLLNYQKNNMN